MNLKYKKSYYNFFLEANDDSYLLYNTRSGAFASVPVSHKKTIDCQIENPNRIINDDVFKELLSGGFIVEADLNELEVMKNELKTAEKGNRELKLALMPTENCNFNCPYCYLYERRPINMKDRTFNGLINLINKSATSKFRLTVEWFGGEPTLAHDKIISFMRNVNQLSKEKEFAYLNYRMTTNGYLLTADRFQEYLNLGLKTFQVTLDGTRERHNQTRHLKNGGGTFDVIWKNMLDIKKLNSEFVIHIRSNFLKNDSDGCLEFMELYKQAFGDDERFVAYFFPVYTTKTKRSVFCDMQNELLVFQEGKLKSFEYDANLTKKIGLSNGGRYFVTKMPIPKKIFCNCQAYTYWIVGADGLMYRCDQFICNKDYACGRLNEDGSVEIYNNDKIWKNTIYDNADHKCLSCKLLPICQGGCKALQKHTGDGCFFTLDEIYTRMLNAHKLLTNRYQKFQKVEYTSLAV